MIDLILSLRELFEDHYEPYSYYFWLWISFTVFSSLLGVYNFDLSRDFWSRSSNSMETSSTLLSTVWSFIRDLHLKYGYLLDFLLQNTHEFYHTNLNCSDVIRYRKFPGVLIVWGPKIVYTQTSGLHW